MTASTSTQYRAGAPKPLTLGELRNIPDFDARTVSISGVLLTTTSLGGASMVSCQGVFHPGSSKQGIALRAEMASNWVAKIRGDILRDLKDALLGVLAGLCMVRNL